jgi:hypothetical protein
VRIELRRLTAAAPRKLDDMRSPRVQWQWPLLLQQS